MPSIMSSIPHAVRTAEEVKCRKAHAPMRPATLERPTSLETRSLLALSVDHSDTSFEQELRAILEGHDWGVVWKDFPRLAHRVEIWEGNELVQVEEPGVWQGQEDEKVDNTLVESEYVDQLDSRQSPSPHLLPDTTKPDSIEQDTNPASSNHSSSSDASSQSRFNNLSTLLTLARHLEPEATLTALRDEIKKSSYCAQGDHIAVKHLVTNILTTSSPTARLLRALNQCIVLTGAYYLHQNLLGPCGLMARDVRGPEGWKIIVRFCEAIEPSDDRDNEMQNDESEDPPVPATASDIPVNLPPTTLPSPSSQPVHRNRAIYISHQRRERSLDGAPERFLLDWCVHLAFDQTAQFQGAMLKVARFEVDHKGVDPARRDELLRRFCGTDGLVIQQEVVNGVVGSTLPRGGRVMRRDSQRARSKLMPAWLKPLRKKESRDGEGRTGFRTLRGGITA
ncbi:uncharacterized protein SPPG_04593 [Spizellomyces punctatus DAOM BR117]|uniref:Uncharacterized protein n=1 Tax=Spizellomyces punctatus (strain DAOM BR117) TaxID=645134 RepID=A0A0L0HGP7_SPIPD|nr:uncharacterized protein SPPG_04593 [Spizellomyces punctatus DAOM BR117]KND00263.1 hypothetical protein SPPG_04593 [Spizellomyces punctatus DAOM BR117]|eukprot:XP_016608302.1 hypothetical protein SPPG_04593 [Spizellomyces punctatus DAOM BR117]